MNTNINIEELKVLVSNGLSDRTISKIIGFSQSQIGKVRRRIGISATRSRIVQSIEGEEWKPIREYEGLYEVSNKGRIKRLSHMAKGNKENNFQPWGESLTAQIEDSYGYVRCKLQKDNKRKFMSVHRMVAVAFIPNPNNLSSINHKDGNKLNNCVENLEWCSPKENNIHAITTGLFPESSRKRKKMKPETVIIIKNLISQGITNSQISRDFNIHLSTVKRIKNKKLWKNLN